MKKTKLCFFALLLAGVMLFGTVAMTACAPTTEGKPAYNVTYNLNYDGADSRVYSVQSGVTAPQWKPGREGYRIDYWATDAAGSNKYDFSKKVYSDLTLYAVWKQKPGMATVTFDFGYAGASNKVIEVEKQTAVNTKYVPKHERYGMELVGWCSDEALENEWNFDTDVVTDNIVLHAKYKYTINIPRNDDGSIAYNNTKVYVWNSVSHVVNPTTLQKLVDAFNAEHEGKIVVEAGTALVNQSDVFLRIQQTPEQMKNYTTYYPVADIFTFAGMDFSNEDFYTGATNECKNKGVMLQTPVAAAVPYIVYNKTLLNKYSDNGALPTNYTQLSALLQKAAAGETSNSNFYGMVTTNNWSFKEAPSYIAFAQNNAAYYEFTSGMYINTWQREGVMDRALRAMQITYDLLGVNGKDKGHTLNIEGSTVHSEVAKGNALFGLQTWPGSEGTIAANTGLGVMSAAGLFTDNTDEASNGVPVHGWGIGFYKYATTVLADALKVCAAAEFAKYVSDNAYVFAKNGYAPLSKIAAANEAYVNSTNPTVMLVRDTTNPEHFFTLAGSANLKSIVNSVAAEGVIVPYLTDSKATRDMAADKLKSLFDQVAGMVS